MNDNQVYKELSENINNLDNIENGLSRIELAIYKKSLENLEETKINELREFFDQKAQYYSQKIEKYNNDINKNIERYKKEIDKLISTYDYVYINVFKIMQEAMCNQKIAIANIVTLTEKLKKEKLDDKDREKTKNTIIAVAEKKLNYAVIIDECRARLKWCLVDAQDSINSIFQNEVHQLQINDDNVFAKIRKSLFNLFFGKNSYKNFLENYRFDYLKSIKQNNNYKMLEVSAILRGVIKQMDITKKQISSLYDQKVCA